MEPLSSTGPDDRAVREEIQNFIYENPLTSFMANLGHRKVRNLKRSLWRGHGTAETLDLCCGMGHNAEFRNSFERFTGLDHSGTFLELARNRFPSERFVEASVLGREWPLTEHTFDFITANQALEHFSNEDLRVILRNVSRYLAKGGRFIYVIPLDHSFAVNLGRKLTSERHMRKRFWNLDYRHWLRNREHINDYANITREVQAAFVLEREVFLPFNVPVVHLNAFNIGVCSVREGQPRGS